MNTGSRNALNAYKQVDTDVRILEASPHQLIAMLYQEALQALLTARSAMQKKQISAKGEAFSRTISIIDEGLKISLDEVKGGDLATNLKALYEYMVMRLLHANLNNDLAAVDEVGKLLMQLKTAWDEIGRQPVKAEEIAPPAEGAESKISQRA